MAETAPSSSSNTLFNNTYLSVTSVSPPIYSNCLNRKVPEISYHRPLLYLTKSSGMNSPFYSNPYFNYTSHQPQFSPKPPPGFEPPQVIQSPSNDQCYTNEMYSHAQGPTPTATNNNNTNILMQVLQQNQQILQVLAQLINAFRLLMTQQEILPFPSTNSNTTNTCTKNEVYSKEHNTPQRPPTSTWSRGEVESHLNCTYCKKSGHDIRTCKFRPYCRFCGKRGHLQDQCYVRQNKCLHCERTGHIINNCLQRKNKYQYYDNDNDECPICEGNHFGIECPQWIATKTAQSTKMTTEKDSLSYDLSSESTPLKSSNDDEKKTSTKIDKVVMNDQTELVTTQEGNNLAVIKSDTSPTYNNDNYPLPSSNITNIPNATNPNLETESSDTLTSLKTHCDSKINMIRQELPTLGKIQTDPLKSINNIHTNVSNLSSHSSNSSSTPPVSSNTNLLMNSSNISSNFIQVNKLTIDSSLLKVKNTNNNNTKLNTMNRYFSKIQCDPPDSTKIPTDSPNSTDDVQPSNCSKFFSDSSSTLSTSSTQIHRDPPDFIKIQMDSPNSNSTNSIQPNLISIPSTSSLTTPSFSSTEIQCDLPHSRIKHDPVPSNIIQTRPDPIKSVNTIQSDCKNLSNSSNLPTYTYLKPFHRTKEEKQFSKILKRERRKERIAASVSGCTAEPNY